MSIFKVTLTDANSSGRRNFLNFDCTHETVEDFYDALSEAGMVYGQHLYVGQTDAQDRKVVVERRPRILGIAAVYSVEPVTIVLAERGEAIT